MLRQDLRVDICGQTKEVCEKVDPGSAKFLFIPDLTASAKGGVLVTLIILYVGSQLASSLLMSVSADKNQRRLILALPLVFVAFIINFPAGLILYWITTNLWTIGQQYLVKRTVGPIRPPALAGATAGAGGGSSGGGSSGSSADGSGAGGSSGNGSSGGGGGLLAALTGGGRGKEAEPVAPEKPVRKTPPPQSPRKKKKRSGRRR
jgi:YidC/Oxa1 family membrane protein insertase